MSEVSRISKSPQETEKIAASFTKLLKEGDIVFLKGDLGAGKTVFTKGLAKALKVKAAVVNSPTFIIMNQYEGKIPLYHFDLYRLEDKAQLASIPFNEYFYGDGICVIEWPQRLGKLAPKDFWLITIDHQNETTRKICISYPSNPQRKISL